MDLNYPPISLKYWKWWIWLFYISPVGAPYPPPPPIPGSDKPPPTPCIWLISPAFAAGMACATLSNAFAFWARMLAPARKIPALACSSPEAIRPFDL